MGAKASSQLLMIVIWGMIPSTNPHPPLIIVLAILGVSAIPITVWQLSARASEWMTVVAPEMPWQSIPSCA